MRRRGVRPFDTEASDVPMHEARQIDDIFRTDVTRAEKLFWQGLGLVRGNEANPELIRKVEALPARQRDRLVQLANYWLPTPELNAFKIKLKDVANSTVGQLQVEIPFGKCRALQEPVRHEARELL